MNSPDDPYAFPTPSYGPGAGAGYGPNAGAPPPPPSVAPPGDPYAAGVTASWNTPVGVPANLGPDGLPAIGRPPVVWLYAALGAAVVGLVIALLLNEPIGLVFVGWFVAGPVAIGLLAAFSVFDTRRQAQPIYDPVDWAKTLYYVVVAVAMLGVLLSAWWIAQWAGRL